jgi:hypothetical protein
MSFQKNCAAVAAVIAIAGLTAAAPAGATLLDCSRPLTHNLTLTEDSSCAGGISGTLVIGADHVTVNLNGHSLLETFGPVITSSGHRFDTIENGGLFTQGTPMPLNNVRYFTIRNVSAGGDIGGIVLTGGSHNRVINTETSVRFSPEVSLQLVHEREDVLRNDSTPDFDGCRVELDQSFDNRLENDTFGALILHESNRNRIVRDHIVSATSTGLGCSNPFVGPGGITGTGNFNLVSHNVITGGAISLTGVGNLLLHNEFPT